MMIPHEQERYGEQYSEHCLVLKYDRETIHEITFTRHTTILSVIISLTITGKNNGDEDVIRNQSIRCHSEVMS